MEKPRILNDQSFACLHQQIEEWTKTTITLRNFSPVELKAGFTYLHCSLMRLINNLQNELQNIEIEPLPKAAQAASINHNRDAIISAQSPPILLDGDHSQERPIDSPHQKLLLASSDPAQNNLLAHEIPKLRPALSEFKDFQHVLMVADKKNARNYGFCYVELPDEAATSTGTSDPMLQAKASIFMAEKREDTFRLTRSEKLKRLESAAALEMAPNDDQAALECMEAQFCDMLEHNNLQSLPYWTDQEVKTERQRLRLGLPSASAIWPLSGNMLDGTSRIPGLHTPFAYLAPKGFGTPFAIHQEDWNLYSIHHLSKGYKLWCIIQPDEKKKLEMLCSEALSLSHDCDQFLRHNSTYLPVKKLKEWEIRYTLVLQKPNTAIITYPGAYHQGFSVTGTIGEAVNYADSSWQHDKYVECGPRCPSPKITRKALFGASPRPEVNRIERTDDKTRHNSAVVRRNKRKSRQTKGPSHRKIPRLDSTPELRRGPDTPTGTFLTQSKIRQQLESLTISNDHLDQLLEVHTSLGGYVAATEIIDILTCPTQEIWGKADTPKELYLNLQRSTRQTKRYISSHRLRLVCLHNMLDERTSTIREQFHISQERSKRRLVRDGKGENKARSEAYNSLVAEITNNSADDSNLFRSTRDMLKSWVKEGANLHRMAQCFSINLLVWLPCEYSSRQ